MQIKKGSKLYARIDYEVVSLENITPQDAQTHLCDHLSYLNKIAGERYFLGGGFTNASGGMILFEAKDFGEAQKIANNDPIIERGLFRCDIFEWTLEILSEV